MVIESIGDKGVVGWKVSQIPTSPTPTDVIKELRESRTREQHIIGFGRFLVSFGSAVAVVGAVAAVAISVAGLVSLFSTPVGWAVGVGLVVVAGAGLLVGIGIISAQSQRRLANILDCLKKGILCSLGVVTFGLAWSVADRDSLKEVIDETTGGKVDEDIRISRGILFSDWKGEKPGDLKLTLTSGQYKITKEGVSIQASVTKNVAFATEPKELILESERDAAYKKQVLPSVKKGKYKEACDALWCLYNNERDPAKKRNYAIDIAALMVRAKEKPRSMKQYFDDNLTDTLNMLSSEIGKMSEKDYDARLLVAHHLLNA